LNKTFFMNNVFDAFDNVDQRDTNLINFAGLDTINLNQVGTFFFRAWLKDAAGNTSKTTGGSITIDTVMFLVEVKSNDDDKEPPKITINGEQTQYIYRGEAYVELGATVTDDNPCFVGSVSRQGSVNVNTSGKYDITYSATDNSGNQAQSIRTVYVGVEPKASFKDEKLQAGKLIATNTSTGIEIPASYTWYSKKANSINNPRIATTQNLNVNATSAIKAFDSLCLRVQNVFNSAPKNKPISNFCTKFAYSSLTEFNEANLGLRVFPIPSNGSFKVAVDGQYFNKEAKFQMIDLQGRKVAEKTVLINSIEVPLDFNDLAPNPYMLFISIDGAHYQTKVQISK
ncbi:MAG: DUF5011 domain-containing protein, partial [Chitinophagales bacterium]|nr:DUF5011 domain-containing protein [Chitinophagales bacterium]